MSGHLTAGTVSHEPGIGSKKEKKEKERKETVWCLKRCVQRELETIYGTLGLIADFTLNANNFSLKQRDAIKMNTNGGWRHRKITLKRATQLWPRKRKTGACVCVCVWNPKESDSIRRTSGVTSFSLTDVSHLDFFFTITIMHISLTVCVCMCVCDACFCSFLPIVKLSDQLLGLTQRFSASPEPETLTGCKHPVGCFFLLFFLAVLETSAGVSVRVETNPPTARTSRRRGRRFWV